MIQKIKSYAFSIIALLTFAVPVAVPLTVAAANNCNSSITQSVSTGASAAAGSGSNVDCSPVGTSGNVIGDTANKIVNIFSIIVGAVAVIMIIYGGFRYITSGGSSERIGGAKNTLIYAIIGLVIVAVAQLIVHFVLNQANAVGT